MAKTRLRVRPDEVMFRVGTGAFALVLVVGVLAIGFELYRQSTLSLHEFGWQFWQTDTWDPVAGQFGARPFIWGTLYSSVLAILISTPIALGIAIYISELAPACGCGQLLHPRWHHHRAEGSAVTSGVHSVGSELSTRRASPR